MAELHLAWSLSFPTDRFGAQVRYRKLDGATITDFRGGGFTGQRVPAEASDGEMIGISVNLAGRVLCRHSDTDIMLEPHQILLWHGDLARSFEAVDPHHELTVLVPRSRVPQRLAEAAEHTRSAVHAASGCGLAAIAAEQLRAIGRELDNLSEAAMAIATQSFLDTLDSALSPVVERPSPNKRSALLRRIRQHVEHNLDDPGLCANSIAAAHGIAVRTLHLVFADSGTTVARLIRERRLRAAYRDLARAGHHATVTEVAYRWGFSDSAHFSRLFKKEYGITPSSLLTRPGGLEQSEWPEVGSGEDPRLPWSSSAIGRLA
ncbi:helix-turn-helix domain-containing protein [Nocardioides limicola]|uniref:helix-turn-helix domain-containing protein n=1 Tax=Nocardioides limicola TaxID=2803368 RepID=UPI00193B2192|nr:helix-turn-helix domain-containing protein [Nocardioides sp. DJM-14]